MARKFRLSYGASIPFSKWTTIVLIALYAAGFAGLLAWNIIALAKAVQCAGYTSGNYDSRICAPSQLQFAGTYFTRPSSDGQADGTIGLFPWTPLGFGNSNGDIDYSYLTLNWTADPLQCVMFQQQFTLHLDSEASTISASYYCGPYLRVLSTTLDSERTQIPSSAFMTFEGISNNITQLSIRTHAIANSFRSNGTVLSVRVAVRRSVANLDAGVLPFQGQSDSLTVQLGTTLGIFSLEDGDAGGAGAVYASAVRLSNVIEAATTRDLQPDAGSLSGQRTLQASYVCTRCEKQKRPFIELIALIIPAIFGVLTPAFAAAKIGAELIAPNKKAEQLPTTPGPMSQKPPSVSGTPTGQAYVPVQPYQQSPWAPQQNYFNQHT